MIATDVPVRMPTELTPIEHARLHHQAVALAAQWREFFPDVDRPTGCPFDTHRARTPLGEFMRTNATRGAA